MKDPNSTPSRQEQKEVIKKLLETCDTLKEGDTWHIISSKWYELWLDYVNFHDVNPPPEVPPPTAINNEDLIEEGFLPQLKADLSENLDFKLLHEDVAKKLIEWYGIQCEIERKVININGLLRVELYPILISLNGSKEKKKVFQWNQGHDVPVLTIKYNACANWSLSQNSHYLFNWVKCNEFSLIEDEGKHLGEFRNVFVLSEQKDWKPRTDNLRGVVLDNTDDTPTTDEEDADADGEETEVDSRLSKLAPASATPSTTTISSRPSNNRDQTSSNTATESSISELSSSASNNLSLAWGRSSVSSGLVGLTNLGNTCFMNTALQCLSAAKPLTTYFLQGQHRNELNRDNPLGMKGVLAERYGELITDIWKPTNSCVTPSRFKFTLSQFAPQFSGSAQQDTQEFLSFLLDGLHEDLNRIQRKPTVPTIESDGRPDEQVAQQSWDGYLQRNRSVIVDLFQGQFKSTVTCPECNRVSITFDPFQYLSVPIPWQQNEQWVSAIVIFRDSNKAAVRYAVRVDKRANFGDLKEQLKPLCGLTPEQMTVVTIQDHKIRRWIQNLHAVSDIRSEIYVFEVATPEEMRHNQAQKKRQELLASASEQDREKAKTLTDQSLPLGIVIYLQVVHRPGNLKKAEKEQRMRTDTAYISYPIVISLADHTTNAEVLKIIRTTLYGLYFDQTQTTREEFESKISQNGPDTYFVVLIYNATEAQEKIVPENNEPFVLNVSREIVIVDWTAKGLELISSKDQVWKIQDHPSNGEMETARNKTLTLTDLLKLFTAEEKLNSQNAWYCNKCKKHQEATKIMNVYFFPKILVIQLKRFYYARSWREKIDTKIHFPLDSFDVSEFEICPAQYLEQMGMRKPPVYELFAVANHMGGLGGGHYVAYAKKENEWYNFNDSSVRSIPKESVCSSQGYVLFYRRKDLNWDNIPPPVGRVFEHTQSASDEGGRGLSEDNSEAIDFSETN